MAENGQRRDPVNHRTKAQVARNNKKHGTTPEAKKDRAQRNRARRKMIKAGKARVGDGKDTAHVESIKSGGSNALSNLRMRTTKTNRGHQRKA